jgi:DNA mismatch repair protein MutL
VSAGTAAAPAPRIALLDPLVADQIAAGEVIERPASVVKELVENALDAGAREIHVALEDGGRKRVAVRDDGYGMSPDDAQRACLRHATSKLRRIEDLDRMQSLGFRGEALASIAAAAEVTIVTRAREESSGVRLRIAQGQVRETVPAGAPVGTTIEVCDLFRTLPARRKFLKTAATEQAHISEMLQRLALARPEVGFTCVHGSREVFRYPPVARGEERVRQVLGAERAKVMVPVEGGAGDLLVRGWASRAGESYPQARSVLTYVDGRLVRDRVLTRAVLDAYRALLPSGRYPSVVLFLDLPPGTVDVNVHPAKVEVRFAQADAVYGLVVRALRGALADAVSAPGEASQQGALAAVAASSPSPAEVVPERTAGAGRVQEALARYAIRRDGGGQAPLFRTPSPRAPQPAAPPERECAAAHAHGHGAAAAAPDRPTFAAMRLVGQAFGGYVVCEAGSTLVLVDQHAAHERVRFERLRAAPVAPQASSQRLLVPRVVELELAVRERLLAQAPELVVAGFEIEPFGDRAVVLRALPVALDVATDAERLLAELAQDLLEIGASEQMATAHDAMLARVACHGAVRFGDPLERTEMVALLADLDTIPFAATCPHGRPLLIELERAELLRRVRR